MDTCSRKIIYILIGFSFLTGCKEPYDANIALTDTGFLVVEGYINIGTKAVTTVMLSRTTPIDQSSAKVYETGASVSIENSTGESFQLLEADAGTYLSDSLSLPAQDTYRIRISIGDKLYFSEFVTPVLTPEIDSVSWSLQSKGVSITVSTHNNDNETQNYQWEFDEVWEVKSEGVSLYDYNGGNWSNRPPQEIKDMQTCWTYIFAKGLNVYSTKSLRENIVLNRPVKSIPLNDPRLNIRYSILVKQHVLSDEAYNYIQLILSNSENVGTFTDPMPGQLTGNIYCASTNEPVVGYIEAYSTTYKRISIYKADVPDWNYQTGCRDTVVGLTAPFLPTLMQTHVGLSFHFTESPDGGLPIRDSVYITPAFCADCRINGGTNLRPPFWDVGEED